MRNRDNRKRRQPKGVGEFFSHCVELVSSSHPLSMGPKPDVQCGSSSAAPGSSQQHAQQAERQLNQSQQWLRMLIDTAEDYAIFAVGPEGKVTTWNKGAEKLFGYTEREILD